MYTFLQEHHLIASEQFSFRSKLSTNVALAQFTEQMLDNLDKKLITGAVFIDLRKALDTVDHCMTSTTSITRLKTPIFLKKLTVKNCIERN